jgi:hypothetical protein
VKTSHANALRSLAERLSQQSFAKEHVQRLAIAAEALGDIVGSHALGESAAARARRVKAASERFEGLLAAADRELSTREAGGLAQLNMERQERLGLAQDQFALDIVRAFGRADQKTKGEILQRIAEEGDGRSLAALASAPAFLSGLDRPTLSSWIDRAESKHAPDLFARRQRFAEDVEAARVAVGAARRLLDEAKLDTEARRATEAERDVLAAEGRLAAAAGE